MKLFHVQGKELKEMEASDEVVFLDGDVYVVDTGDKIWIWIGKDAAVEEGTVAAWVSNKMDHERDGTPDVITINQGKEPEEFMTVLSFKVIDGDTPGFLVPAELDMVQLKMFRVFTKEETVNWDEAEIEEVPLDKSSLNSNDVFVVDGNEVIFVWIGKNASREERFQGQKLMQKIDSGRNYLPVQVTIYEGEGSKAEKAFFEFLEKAKGQGPQLSVEDQREATYKPEEYKTAEEHKATTPETVKASNQQNMSKDDEPVKKRSWWKRLLGLK